MPYDVRKSMPYGVYDKVKWEVPTGVNGDVYDRYRVRMDEFLQSNSIIRQCIDKYPIRPCYGGHAQIRASTQGQGAG